MTVRLDSYIFPFFLSFQFDRQSELSSGRDIDVLGGGDGHNGA